MAKNPRVYFEYETGERYLPEDSDYSDIDYKDYLFYDYSIYKIGINQQISKNKNYSIIYKIITKNYEQSFDNNSNDDNRTNSLSILYKFPIKDYLSCSFQSIYRKRDYEEIQSTKESKWLANSLTLALKPKSDNFFTNENNEYKINIRYKTTNYKYASDKDSKNISYYIEWTHQLTEKLQFETRYKVDTMNYDVENNLRIDSSKKSYLMRVEYQF